MSLSSAQSARDGVMVVGVPRARADDWVTPIGLFGRGLGVDL